MIEIPLYTGTQVQLTELDLEKDAPNIADWCQDPLVFQRVLKGKFHLPTVDEVKKAIEEAMKKAEESEACFYFAVRLIDEPQSLVGYTRVPYLFAMHQFAELALDFRDEETAKKIGLETLKLMLHYLYMEANFYKIESSIPSCEKTICELYEQAGFVKEVVGREAIYYDGEYVDEFVYGMTRPEYKAKYFEVRQ